ncbi:MAG: hypothetical protein ACJA1L_000734, partial [Paracoccaceae bacterium]
ALLLKKDGPQTLIIDSAVVTSSEMIRAVARGAAGAAESAGSTPVASRPNADAQSDPRPYLLFRAGKELSTPLETVSEIIRYPAWPAPLPTRRHGLIGVFVHKGYSVPPFDLVALLGGALAGPAPTASCCWCAMARISRAMRSNRCARSTPADGGLIRAATSRAMVAGWR